MSDSGERLQKLLARRGVASRRGAEDLIRAGRVTVNGRVATLGERAGPADQIAVDGEPLPAEAGGLTIMLNKPPGYLSTVSDERGRPTVMELVPDAPGLHPVGRLDLDSEGLLLLTTDGELTLQLTHPRYGHTKRYRVWCEGGTLPPAAVKRLERGVELEDGPARALWARRSPGGCTLALAEGRKRQVRRMLKEVGFDVVRLRREAVGELELGDLPAGAWRELGSEDIGRALAGGRTYTRKHGGPRRRRAGDIRRKDDDR